MYNKYLQYWKLSTIMFIFGGTLLCDCHFVGTDSIIIVIFFLKNAIGIFFFFFNTKAQFLCSKKNTNIIPTA